jgi:Uma2 family endonuclease
VIEIVSPNDLASHNIALETDYRNIGVGEIVFIDLPKQHVRVLRQRESDYEEEVVTAGPLVLEALARMRLEAAWLLAEPRPDERATVDSLLAET